MVKMTKSGHAVSDASFMKQIMQWGNSCAWAPNQIVKLTLHHLSIHPSIFYTCLIQLRVAGGLEPTPAVTGQEAGGRVHPGQIVSPSQGAHRDKRDTQSCTVTPQDNLESPINITCIFLGGERKLFRIAFGLACFSALHLTKLRARWLLYIAV